MQVKSVYIAASTMSWMQGRMMRLVDAKISLNSVNVLMSIFLVIALFTRA